MSYDDWKLAEPPEYRNDDDTVFCDGCSERVGADTLTESTEGGPAFCRACIGDGPRWVRAAELAEGVARGR